MKKERNVAETLMLDPSCHLTRHILLQIALLIVCAKQFSAPTEELFAFSWPTLVVSIIFYALLNVCCYVNIYCLVPRLRRTGDLGGYTRRVVILSVLTFIALVFCFPLRAMLSGPATPDAATNGDPIGLVTFLIYVVFISLSISSFMLLRLWLTEQKRISMLKSESMNAELTLLKQQINPHFLFNMLNNANVLMHRSPDEASQILLRLEDLLRYQLSDSQKEEVALTSDIRFLGDFLGLEKVRRDRFVFSIDVVGNVDDIMLPPLLFIPFVENAVKHNTDSIGESWVKIRFERNGRSLTFVCMNSKANQERKNDVGGIGMQNIRRRLELLYPNRHELSIVNNPQDFTVNLNISL